MHKEQILVYTGIDINALRVKCAYCIRETYELMVQLKEIIEVI